MIHKSPIILICVMIFLAVIPITAAENWPNWRGPLATGVVPEGKPPIVWSETENIHWKVELEGDGSNSTPIVWGDKLFYQSAIEPGKVETPSEDPPPRRQGRRGFGITTPKNKVRFNLVCRHRKSGKLLWSKTVAEAVPHEGHHPDHGFVSFSPITDGKLIWACFGAQGLYCFDLDGNRKWHAELGPYKTRNQFGPGGSPTLVGDHIVMVKDHEDPSFIVAVHKDTGKEVWKKERNELTNWTTPLAVKVNESWQVIVNGKHRVYGYDALTGAIIWECTGQTQNVVPTPVLHKDLVFCTSGFRGSKLQAIKLGQTGNLTDTPAMVWEVDKDTPYVPSPLCYQGRLYVCSRNKETITCYDAASGKKLYDKTTLPELKGIYASPIGVAGRVYFVGRNGVTSVLRNGDRFEVLATNTLDDRIDCSPVVIGDSLYLKGKQNLYCLKNKP